MKRVLSVFSLVLLYATLMSCTNNNPVQTQTPSEDVKEYLVEKEDYIDISQSYDGKELYYNNEMWYMNKLNQVPLPDPHVFVEDGYYYIIGTSDRNINVVDCYVTTDFNTFEEHLEIFNPTKYSGWESKNPEVYAPEMYYFDGLYYLYYSANDKEDIRRNSVVVSDNPLGPFKPIVNDEVDGLSNPLFYNENYPNRCLDATVFVDDDGKSYIYYVVTGEVQHIVGMKLISPYKADWSTYKELVKPGCIDSNSDEVVLEWEVYRKNKIQIAEAPFMIKSNGKYYMTYSANGCWNKYYNVCYAVSDSPLGNFVKPYEEGKLWTNLLLGFPGTDDKSSLVYKQWSGFASGTGHHCFFNVGDQIMVGYHAHQNRDWNDEKFTPRYFAIDYLYFDDSGVPFVNGPSWSVMPLPFDISGYKNIVTGSSIKSDNVINVNAINDNYIVDAYNLDSKDKEVILNEGVSTIEINFDKEYSIYGIAVFNSAYYENLVIEIEYLDFGNGNIIYYPQYCLDFYVDDDLSFIYPVSAINVEILNPFKASSVKIGFVLPEGGSINEVVILGK